MPRTSRHSFSTWQRLTPAGSAGFGLVELCVVVAVLSIVAAISLPFYLNYLRAQQADTGARELVTMLNQARQLAITRNTSFSVEVEASPQNRVRFCTGTATPCPGGAVWIGAGTDSAGWMGLDNDVRIVANQAVTFSSMGASTTAARVIQVRDPAATSTLSVCVSPSGRLRITAPTASCP
jgi:prepilin-type N-terminal cleavage/methylation domain-containing protein